MVCLMRQTSPLPVKFAKITVVLIFFCFAECAAGSCLSYGHACWGAHGKRNGASSNQIVSPSGGRGELQLPNTRWFLSRLVQSPMDLRYLRDLMENMPAAASSSHTTGNDKDRRLFSPSSSGDVLDMETDPLKGSEDYRNDISDEELFDEVYPRQRRNVHKMKTQQILNKRSIRMT